MKMGHIQCHLATAVLAWFVSMLWSTAAFLSFSVVMKTKPKPLCHHVVAKARKVSGMIDMVIM